MYSCVPRASACPLEPPTNLFPSVAVAYSSANRVFPSCARCCPALNAWLLAAYFTSALAARSLSSAGFDLPTLPDDSESCIRGVERELWNRRVVLPRLNSSCARAFVADASEGWWVPVGDLVRWLQRNYADREFARCTRCLRTLNQVSDPRLLADATTCSHWPSNPLLCDHLLSSLRALSLDPSLPDGKLHLQSDLNITTSTLTVHLHNFHLLLCSGLLRHDTSPSAPGRRGSNKEKGEYG